MIIIFDSYVRYNVCMKIAVVSGGFDPIHSGHINYLQSAAEIGDKVIVCLNSDNWLEKKKVNSSFLLMKES